LRAFFCSKLQEINQIMTPAKLFIIGIAVLFGSTALFAQEPPPAPDYGWSGKGEFEVDKTDTLTTANLVYNF